jgi:hypothetical protein
MIAGNERAARRLTRASDRFGGKKLREGRLELGFGIGFPVRCEKETGFVGFAFVAADKGWMIV